MNEEVYQQPWTENAHKVFRYILLGQLALCVLIGFITDTLLLGLLVGVPIVAVPIILTLQYPHHAVSRHAVGIATQLMTALHIQQAFGMTEMHFEVFVMLAFLFFYRDWKVVVSATLVVAVHHVLFFILQGAGMPFIIVEEGRVQFYVLVIHAVFAVAEAAVLAVMAHRSHNEAMAAETLAVSVRKITNNDGLINLADFTPMNTPSLASFNNMMLTVKSLIQEANQVSENLHSVVNKVSLSSNELDQAVDQQDQQVSSIKSAMQNITSSINEVALLSQGANEIADQAKSSTDQTRTALDGSNANISQLKETLETTSVAISDLSAKCSNISEVMQSIKSVAEQTNLLALNAAIESARAGEHGRGFAVVADEVRNLAIKSKESAEEIELITSQLTDSANNSVQNMVNCVSMVELAVESSSEASNNMASVMSSIDSVNQNVTTVAGAATEQAQTSETITVSTEELYGLFVGEKQQVQSLRIDVENLSSLAIQLQTQLKQFKVN